MHKKSKRDPCRNMNHGKMNPGVKFCPSCGERFKSTCTVGCDEEKHQALRKDRNLFCPYCGKSLQGH